jgi:Methyltransferase domain
MTTLAPHIPSPESLCLPRGYRQQTTNLTLDVNRDNGSYWAPWRIAESHKWQYHVYRWGAELIAREGLSSALDVGCGICAKMTRHLVPVCPDTEGIDQPSALEVARRLGAQVKLTPVDLERPELRPWRTFDLIICADVLEHLVDPDPTIQLIRSFAHERSLILLSTPERDRQRGRGCMASAKPEHVREWTRGEFEAFVRSRGLHPIRSRLLPGDDTPIEACRDGEIQFRLHKAATSPRSCTALLCRPGMP